MSNVQDEVVEGNNKVLNDLNTQAIAMAEARMAAAVAFASTTGQGMKDNWRDLVSMHMAASNDSLHMTYNLAGYNSN